MYEVFLDLEYVETYLDDVVIHATSLELMFRYFEEVFKRPNTNHLKINWKKCQWFKLKVRLLGQVISHNLIEMDKDKIRVLLDWPVPSNVQALQEFLGLANYNRNKIVMFAQHAGPPLRVTKT